MVVCLIVIYAYLARSANLSKGLYNLPMFFFIFFYIFNGRLSTGCFSKSYTPIFTKISRFVDGCKVLFSSLSFFSISQETLPWQPIKVEKSAFFPDQSTLSHCHSEMDCDIEISFKKINRMNCSTSCPILVIFGSETPEFTLLTITPFAAIRQKSTCHAKYLRISWTYLDLIYGFGRRVGRDDYPDIRLAVAQGTLLWQLVKFGICSPTSQGTNFTLCFGVRQRTGQSYNDFKGLNDNNPATYVVYKFGKLQSNNLRVYAVNNNTVCGDTAKIDMSRQISQNILDLS